MTYKEKLFRERVENLGKYDVLFETLGTAFMRHSDGRLWLTGTNSPYSSPVEDVEEYVEILQNIIETAGQWNLDENQLNEEIARIRDEIADYQE